MINKYLAVSDNPKPAIFNKKADSNLFLIKMYIQIEIIVKTIVERK